MIEILKKIGNTRNYLLFSNVLLVFCLIFLKNLNILPVSNAGNFLFFTFLLTMFALYRPGWAFLFFVGTIPLEDVNVAPPDAGFNIRPYQWLAAAAIFSVVVRLLAKRLPFRLPAWRWTDIAPLAFAASSFVSALFSQSTKVSLKFSLIAASFAAIYYLVRIFIQDTQDFKKIIPFFLSSSAIVVLYGIWQNFRFLHGSSHFEAMAGRPDSSFTEPDWLGMFLVFLAAGIYSLLYENLRSKTPPPGLTKIITCPIFLFLYVYLILIFILIIITVSRSAWLGIFIVTFFYLLAILIDSPAGLFRWQWRKFLHQLVLIIAVLIVSLIYIYFLPLTSFQLFNRAQSTASGLQKVTIACNSQVALPQMINSLDELEKFSCSHINLENIEQEKNKGKYVTEIYRPDPNIKLRGQIYSISWQAIRSNGVLGIGWGSISHILGKDERGINLNASNIFLEIWLGSGIPGLLAYLFAWFSLLISALKKYLNFGGNRSDLQKATSFFIILGWMGLTIANLFNAGIFLGIIWLFLGLAGLHHANRN